MANANDLVGRRFRAWDGNVYECTKYDPDAGFYMKSDVRETCVSERAIGRTFHLIRQEGRHDENAN